MSHFSKLILLRKQADELCIRPTWIAPWPYVAAWSRGARLRPSIFAGCVFNVVVNAVSWVLAAGPLFVGACIFLDVGIAGRPHLALLGSSALVYGSLAAARIAVVRKRLRLTTWAAYPCRSGCVARC